jgi:hypothetical protein
VAQADRAGDIIHRIRDHIKKAPLASYLSHKIVGSFHRMHVRHPACPFRHQPVVRKR